DPGLRLNAVFTDAAGISISPVWANSTGVGVNVAVAGGSAACVRGAPTVQVSPADQQANAGDTLSYSIAITNNDSGCSTATFDQTAAVPSGWVYAFDAPSLTISAGATAWPAVDGTPAAPAAGGDERRPVR